MENWGLVTYREQSLFYDPKVSSNEDKEWVVTVIAHELAHMVCGELISLCLKMVFLTNLNHEIHLCESNYCLVVWEPCDHEMVERPVAQ